MKISTALFVTVLASLTFISSFVFAHENKVGDLTIMHTWANATPKSARTGAAYLMIKNSGAADDTLIDVKSDKAKKTQTHLSSMTNGMMKMKHVDRIKIPAGGKVELKPGGHHIMFMGLKAPFEENTSFPLTLVFEKSGEVTINVPVKKGMGYKMKKMKKHTTTN